MSRRISSYISAIDMFGQPIQLKFNGSGSTHNTIIGGLLSIPAYIFMVFYLYLLYTRVNNPQYDDTSQIVKKVAVNELQTIQLNNFVVFTISKTSNNQPISADMDKLSSYIDIIFE